MTRRGASAHLGPTHEASPGLAYTLSGYAGALVASALVAAAASAVTGSREAPVVLLAGQVGFWSVLVGAVAHQARRIGVVPTLGGLRLDVRLVDVTVGAALGVLTQLVLIPALYIPLRGFLDIDELARPARDLLDRVEGPGLIVMGLAVVLVAPVVEELYFRGLLLGALRPRWGTGAAVMGSSMVFGVTHFQPLQFVGLFAAGLIFAGAAVRTGRLLAAVAVHAGFNATTLVALTLLP